MYKRKCKKCGKWFETNRCQQIYCHAPCGINYSYKKTPKPQFKAICFWCKSEYIIRNPDIQKYCSQECSYSYRKMIDRIYKAFPFDRARTDSEQAKLRLEGKKYQIPEVD